MTENPQAVHSEADVRNCGAALCKLVGKCILDEQLTTEDQSQIDALITIRSLYARCGCKEIVKAFHPEYSAFFQDFDNQSAERRRVHQ